MFFIKGKKDTITKIEVESRNSTSTVNIRSCSEWMDDEML